MFSIFNTKQTSLEPYGYLATIIYHDYKSPYSKQCATWFEALQFVGRYGQGSTIKIDPLYEDADLIKMKDE